MAAPMFDFALSRSRFAQSLRDALQTEELSIALVKDTYTELPGSENEKKNSVDQAFRDVLLKLVSEKSDCDWFTRLITLAIAAVINEVCSPATPFVCLSDIFDGITLDSCAEVFTYVEKKVDTWKSEPFHTAGKNYLLRMCNDLLRRLSKSQDTLFCGRIQLFLARLFPLWEKSGLNLMSQFNLENVTYFNPKSEDYDRSRKQSTESEKEEHMEIEEGEMDDISSGLVPIDYNLYKKFWSLQDYFRRPSQCYEKVPWKTFTNYSDEVLSCFESFKLDDTKSARRRLESLRESQEHTYFAKYLTSEKLLDLQLSDSNFRRYVLVQFLILFQYLGAKVKFKSPNLVLTEEQQAWTQKSNERIYALLQETPPDGAKFAKSIQHILGREDNWSSWKNEGCQSYVKEPIKPTPMPTMANMPRVKKRSMGADLKASGGKLIKMGNAELTRLWNLCPDNEAACCSTDRAFMPKLEEYFEEAVFQSDPSQQIEAEYKLVNNKNWSWKALRLLARSSHHFFQSSSQMGVKLPTYLETMVNKVAKEMPGYQVASQPEGGVSAEVVEEEDIKEEQAEDNLDKPEEQNVAEIELVTSGQIEQLVEELGADWKKLATELNFQDDEIVYFESESADVNIQIERMLTIWKENEGERAIAPILSAALKEIGLVAIAVKVFGEENA